ncbi:MAG TPA: chemotaxis response regulator protein-glutamate methylesterase [Brevundimonas sp.]|jgi:two-component system chemotaxis response regulator CheB|uniref:protein-glutamate methylesterase/protein-glutamine glutaminase n=1 Tax=Brevundimonas sp. TaxID=1871086 RepID=UPI002E149509|nr:chemotaxis response regulator protein-glutamate methylesterase [Brevundimonas sp.]
MTVSVLIVDDSPTMRGLIAATLKRDPDIEVVGYAANPMEARAEIKRLNPDVITLDVEMPGMNGIEFLEKIMRLRPMPVVMVSTLTQAGAEVTLAALELGAVDAVGKPGPGMTTAEAFANLSNIVKTAARSRVRTASGAPAPAARGADYRAGGDHILAIGASTGGVEALLSIISRFPANCPATVITQHMPATFTPSFAARLDRSCAATVQEATDGAPLEPGRIYLAPGGAMHLEVAGSTPRCRLVAGDTVSGHRPSVDVLFHSVARSKRPCTGVILTGMGRDGAEGLLAIRQAGGHTLGQDEASSVVYGMPRAAFEIGAVERQLSLSQMPDAILDLCAARSARAGTH